MTESRKRATVVHMNTYLKQILIVCAIFLSAFGLFGVSRASAATFRAASDYSLASNASVRDNLYTAGRTLLINGEVQKDLAAAGASMTITGPVGADAMLAGGTVDVRGPITGDLRVVGGEVYIHGKIGGDFVAAGGSVQTLPEVSVEGDTVIFGDHVILDGTFAHGVTVRARSVEVRGNVKGPLNVTVAESLAMQDTARLAGGLTYTAKNQATISQGAFIQGTPVFHQSKRNAEKGVGAVATSVFGLLGLIGFLNLVVGTTLLAYLFPRFSKQVVDRVLLDSKKTIATGFIVSLVLPVGTVLFFLTIIGYVFGAVFGLSFLVLLALSKALIGVLAGALLAQWRTKEVKVTWNWALWGAIAVYLIGLVPFIGWFVDIMLFFAVAGALSLVAYGSWWKGRKAPEIVVVDEPTTTTA